VLGRKLAEGFIPAWEAGPEGEDEESIEKMRSLSKVVVSDSLDASPWEGAVIRGGDLTEIVTDLRAQPGGDLIAYGGSTLVTSLIARELLDELHLFVNPTAIGGGLPVFPPDTRRRFRTVAARTFDCGITVVHLEPLRT